MKRIVTALLAIFLVSNVFYAQSKTEFGIDAGLVLPTGDLSDLQSAGFNLGFGAKFRTKSPTTAIALGLNYSKLSGETINLGSVRVEVESADILSFYGGPRFGKENGFYFLPAAALNFIDGETRVGLDLGTGFLVPINKITKFNIGVQFNMTNIIGKDDGEISFNVFKIVAGIHF